MPDGRLAAIGLVDLMPGVERTDGRCVAGIATPLLVLERDGSVSRSRDLRVRCQTLDLVAADADTAYLLREDRLVAHDLATGDERVLLGSAPQAGPGLDYAAGRLVVVTEGDEPSCGPGTVGRLVIQVVEVATGATAEYPQADQSCDISGGPVRLSPDGRYAAYEYLRYGVESSHRSQVRVAILDLTRGEVVVDQLVAEVTGRDGSWFTSRSGVYVDAGEVTAGVVGLAWDDLQTLRLGWYEVPRDGVYWLPDVVQQTTVTVHP